MTQSHNTVEMSESTELALPEPGDRMLGRVWLGYLVGIATIALYAVSVPTLSTIYDLFVPVAFLVAAAHSASLALALFRRPRLTVGLSSVAVFATAMLSGYAYTGDGTPWPMPVATMITQLLVVLALALRGDRVGTAAAAILGAVAAAVPAGMMLIQEGEVPGALGNLVTFSSIAVLVGALGLVVRGVLAMRQGHRS